MCKRKAEREREREREREAARTSRRSNFSRARCFPPLFSHTSDAFKTHVPLSSLSFQLTSTSKVPRKVDPIARSDRLFDLSAIRVDCELIDSIAAY